MGSIPIKWPLGKNEGPWQCIWTKNEDRYFPLPGAGQGSFDAQSDAFKELLRSKAGRASTYGTQGRMSTI